MSKDKSQQGYKPQIYLLSDCLGSRYFFISKKNHSVIIKKLKIE